MSEVGVSYMKSKHMEVDLGWAQGDRVQYLNRGLSIAV